MPFVQRFWRTLRLGMLIIVFIGTTFYLALTTPWARYFLPAPRYTSIIQQGRPIVAAIYAFKADRGLWPEYLDELSPAYLPKRPSSKWYYVGPPVGPSLEQSPDNDRTHVGFNFAPVSPAWRVSGNGDERILQPEAPPGPSTLPAGVRIENELAELDRRIRWEPDLMEHRRAKASFLRSLGRMAAARVVIRQAAAAAPFHFWPRIAALALDLEVPAGPPGSTTGPDQAPALVTAPALSSSLRDFDRWAHDPPTFTHLYYLSLIRRLAHQTPEALSAVEEAAKLPPAVGADDMSRPAFYLWDMARFALEQKQWDLTLKLTASWEKMQSDGRGPEDSYLALAAAAHLAQGNFAAAQASMDNLDARKNPTWAQNLAPLRQAVAGKNAAFRYDPGDDPPPFQIFAVPQ
jgi:hypothetical protein